MRDIAIIGTGRWAKRIEKFVASPADLIDPRKRSINVSGYLMVIICVPSPFIDQVLRKTKFADKNQMITSCVKGLMKNGMTVCDYLRDRIGRKSVINFMGGANLDCGDESFRQVSSKSKLEIISILKNVYAIGFGYYNTKFSPNASANYLSRVVSELSILNIRGELLDDLFASCFSTISRNRTFGEAMAMGLNLSEKTIEGRHTAKIIKKHNLFSKLTILREITDLIYEYK